jgi:general secretion pathway protein K
VLGAQKEAALYDADRIIGWRSTPALSSTNDEEALYNMAGLSYPPRQAPFAHVSELALVVGLPPALVDRALPFVTVFNGSSGVNPAIAEPEVIAALPDKGSDKMKEALSGDPSMEGNASAPASTDATAAKSTCYRIAVTINFDDGRRTASEGVIVLGNKVEPYRVLSWQDDVTPRSSMQRRRGI